MTDNWYVIYSRPRLESLANEHLQRQGFTTLFPRRQVGTKQNQPLTAPFYPRYLFASFPFESLSKIRSTRGVSRLVEFVPGEPLKVDNWILSELRSQLDDAGVMISTKIKPMPDEISSGEPVSVVLGRFSGCQGVYLSRSGRWVRVQLKPNGMTVSLPREDVVRLIPVV